MRKHMIGLRLLSVLAAFGGVVGVALAADSYKVDAVHSSVIFRIKHMSTSFFYGRFNEISGSFTLDDDAAKCKFEFELKVDSVDSNNDKRDQHLKSPDFFDAKEYPTIKFVSKTVKAAGESYDVTGDLTMHGKTKEIAIKIDKTGAGKGPGGNIVGIESNFTVKRSDFGMKVDDKMLSDEVKLMVGIEAGQK